MCDMSMGSSKVPIPLVDNHWALSNELGILVGQGGGHGACREHAGSRLRTKGKMQNFASSGSDSNSHIRVLVDDVSARADIAQVLETLHIATQSYGNIEEFFAQNSLGVPRCIIVAWHADLDEVLNVVARCRAQWAEVAVLLIADNPTVAFTVAAMRSGVDGILEKPIHSAELIREVQTVITRSQSRCAQQHDHEEARHRISQLNDIEAEILKLVANGVPNKNIALAMSLSLRTVEKYRHSLFENLCVNSAAEATRIWVLAHLDHRASTKTDKQ